MKFLIEMKHRLLRTWLLALLGGTVLAVSSPAAYASFGVEENHFEAITCVNPACTYTSPKGDFYTQAAGHPPWGITTFELNHTGSGAGRVPLGALKRIRVDVPPGLAANPQALPRCKRSDFDANACAANTQVGTTELEVYDGITDLPVSGTVYNLEQTKGFPLIFGIKVGVEPLVNEHLLLEGHVEWSGDYHEYFEINNVPKEGKLLGLPVSLAVVKSKLNFNGRAGAGNFLTVPSMCASSTTSQLEVESYEGAVSRTVTHTPVDVDGCGEVPFSPSVTVTPETAQSDVPDGATTVVQVPQKVSETDINTSDIRDAHVTLPEGLTLNPSAAHELASCSGAQIGIGTENPVSCPLASKVGSVTIETDLPPKSLTGSIYLGSPGGGPITGPPFTIYLDAEAPNLGVSVRLQGLVTPNPSTGRLEVTFANNPQLPFSELSLTLNGGSHAPLANPLTCGSASVDFLFTPYTGGAAHGGSTPFVTGGCGSQLPFALTQSTQNSSASAGAYTKYTFVLARPDGQQYLSQIRTVLPAGLVGAIPSVTLCGEPQAQGGGCPAGSRIGSATASVGAGPDPYPFTGPVFLTGPYGGSPYGLSIPIDAAAGPFSLGTIVTRAAINVDPYTGRVIATSTLPTIFKGVPLRLKDLSVAIDRSNFLFNPTNCGPLATDSTLTSTFNATQPLSSPFQVGNCNALAFKPSFAASTGAKTSKATGASLQVTLTQGAHQANIHSVSVHLPVQLPSRLTTLQKACTEATFAANPYGCPVGSMVGSATVTTPVLPGKLAGPAYLVSHGGAAFPDLDIVLEGDGVRVILVGNTNITKGVTISTFAAIPDVPVSSFALSLPSGPYSALAANGNLCAQTTIVSKRIRVTRRVHRRLVHRFKTVKRRVAMAMSMPTTITGQNGAVIHQNTTLEVKGCPRAKHSKAKRKHRKKSSKRPTRRA